MNKQLDIHVYTKKSLPKEGWHSYIRRKPISARRINGPFGVETPEGTKYCRDGYVAIDEQGFPCAITKSEMDAAYDEVYKSPELKPYTNMPRLVEERV